MMMSLPFPSTSRLLRTLFKSHNFFMEEWPVLSNLEAEGQGCGIIMGGAGLLLVGPFYYIALNTGGYRIMNKTVSYRKIVKMDPA